MTPETSGTSRPVRHKYTMRKQENLYDIVEQPVQLDGLPARIVLRKSMISIGCSDVEPEVLAYIQSQYEKKFGKREEEVVLQTGSHPC